MREKRERSEIVRKTQIEFDMATVVIRQGDKTGQRVEEVLGKLKADKIVTLTNVPGSSCQKLVAVVEQIKQRSDQELRQENGISEVKEGMKMTVLLELIG